MKTTTPTSQAPQPAQRSERQQRQEHEALKRAAEVAAIFDPRATRRQILRAIARAEG